MAESTRITAGNSEQGHNGQDEMFRDRASTTPITPTRDRSNSNAPDATSSPTGRLRSASQKILDANIPSGMWSATGIAVAQAPTPAEIRRGSIDSYLSNGNQEASQTSLPKTRTGTQVAEGSTKRGSASTSHKLNKIDDVDDGPPNVFGRPELEDQSYVRGQKSTSTPRIPKLAVRRKSSKDVVPEGSQNTFSTLPAASRPTAAQGTSTEPFPDFAESDSDLDELDPRPKRKSKNVDAMLGRSTPEPARVIERASSETGVEIKQPIPNSEGVYPNGYSFPGKKPWTESTKIGFIAFLRFTFTPLGFFIVLYGLNVVAWGGMLFLLLCNASPAMCRLGDGRSDCDDINSPRRVWVEITSQILNSLFCVTGFGLIPWRFRDLYYWIKWRINKNTQGLRKLAGYHNGWFRLPHSDQLPVKDFKVSTLASDMDNPALPFPLSKAPSPPLTGARAPATALWKMDFVIWMFVWNTFLQAVLSGFMWGLSRYDRPAWSTGLFVALACIVAAAGGLVQFIEGKAIKKVEGVPLEVGQEYRDVEQGISRRERANTIKAEKSAAVTNTN